MDADNPAQAAVAYLCESVSICGFLSSMYLTGRDTGKDWKPQMNTDGRRCPSTDCSGLSVRICVHLWIPFVNASYGQRHRKRLETTEMNTDDPALTAVPYRPESDRKSAWRERM